MPRDVGYPANRRRRLKDTIIDVASDVLSAPARAIQGARGRKAEKQTKAIRHARATDHLFADPQTKAGRGILRSRFDRDSGRRRIRRRRRK